MQDEYEAIASAGLVLQLDCPDLGDGPPRAVRRPDLEEFRKQARLHVEALTTRCATSRPSRCACTCAGATTRRRTRCDVPLADIIDVVFHARPSAISFEAANPRHAHEWAVFETVKLPDGKVLIPGVLESKSNFIEHPELIAQRIARYAKLVGRENVDARAPTAATARGSGRPRSIPTSSGRSWPCWRKARASRRTAASPETGLTPVIAMCTLRTRGGGFAPARGAQAAGTREKIHQGHRRPVALCGSRVMV